ncbi:MAG: DUF4169 family protein [Alphaproteobacteria bacterium]
MAEIVNLRQARRGKKREAEAGQADANRLKFGRTKAEKKHGKQQAELDRARHEGHRVEDEEIS